MSYRFRLRPIAAGDVADGPEQGDDAVAQAAAGRHSFASCLGPTGPFGPFGRLPRPAILWGGSDTDVPDPRRGGLLHPPQERGDGGPQVLRPLGPLAARDPPRGPLQPIPHRVGRRLRRLLARPHRREVGRPRPRARARDRLPRPVLGGADDQLPLRHPRGRHAPALPPRPAHARGAGRGVPADLGRRRLQPLGTGVRVLPLRRRELRERRQHRRVPRRVARGGLEEQRARRRLHDPAPRRLPRHPAPGPPLQRAHEDLPAPRGDGGARQVPPPRGGGPRPVRDRDAA